MAKITQSEFLDNVRNIINEGMNPDVKVDYTKKFNISRYVNGLFESGQRNPKLMTYLNNYNNLLKSNTTKEFMVYEQFGQGLAQFASGNKDVKNVINEMNDVLYNYGSELEAFRLIECIKDPYAKESVMGAYENYLNAEDENSRNILIDAVDMLDAEGEPVAPKLTIVITSDCCNRLPQIDLGTTESKFDEIQRKIKEEKDRKRMEEVKAQVDEYARKVFNDAMEANKAEKAACTFENIVNNNGLNLRESIRKIASSDAKSNKKLMETIEQYAGALNQGLYEERLYEGFVQNISKFNYLLPVNKEIKRINEAAKEHAASIMVTKILEEMSTTNSYYIIPLIEEDAVRYIKTPSDVNRTQLRNALCSFASDPYCNAMLEAIERDGQLLANTLEEKALTIKDQIKMIREDANVSPIYSPVQYIRENECVFNANGQFYVKKGNTLAKLSEEYLNQLSESFVALCQLVNDPRVTINEDNIVLIGNDKIANIYEGYVEINGCKETTDTLRNLNEMTMKYDFDTNFFVMASCLHENFNEIAKINFGKHIALNENSGINVDMFRLGNNIFVNTVNESMLKSTFYHNVNPIQCRNLINKHMGINVASLFEDLIPSQEKLLMKLNETKDEYEASISKYEATIEKLKKAKNECNSEDNEKKLDDAIKSAESKVKDLKKEYSDWQKEVDKATDADADNKSDDKKETKASKKADKELEDDPNTEVEKGSEPIDDEEVDRAKSDLMQPLNGMDIDTEEDPNLSDAEFDEFLGDEQGEATSEVPAGMEISDTNDEIVEEPVDDVPAEMLDTEDEEDPEAFKEVSVDDEPEVEEPEMDKPEMDEPEIEDTDDVVLDEPVETAAVPEGYKIANISFDQNVKTGELFKTGTIVVITPMIDENGKMYVESNDYHFYINEETHIPVLDAANIPVALYNAMMSAIQAEPDFMKADAEGVAAPEEDSDDNNMFYKSQDVSKDSEELEADDEDGFFDFNDEDDSLTITAKDEPEMEEPEMDSNKGGLSDIFDGFEESEDNDSEEKDLPEDDVDDIIIPTYKSGETEIELPAPDVDDTDIPELSSEEAEEKDPEDIFISDEEAKKCNSPECLKKEIEECNKLQEYLNIKQSKRLLESLQQKATEQLDNYVRFGRGFDYSLENSKKRTIPINEARKAIIKLNSEVKKGGKHFFLSEGTIKPSKKEEAHNSKFDGAVLEGEAPMYQPYEEYDKMYDNNTLDLMHSSALNCAEDAKTNGIIIEVGNIINEDFVDYFTIRYINNDTEYVIYQVNNEIYYRDLQEFNHIMYNIDNGINDISSLKYNIDNEEMLNCIDVNNIEECEDLINTIFNTFGVQCDECEVLDEQIKIKKPSLGANGDFEKSKMVEDILHGDEEKRDFEEGVEKETQKAGVVNPLAPSQQDDQGGMGMPESTQVLPNVNMLSEAAINEKKEDDVEIIYEPQDWVIIKETGMKAQVNDVLNDGDGKLKMLTVLASNGVMYDVDPSEIIPDPLYLENLPGRTVNSQNLYVPHFAEFDIDPETRLTKISQNEVLPEDYHRDLNDKVIHVWIKNEGMKLNTEPYAAYLEDVANSKKTIRVITEGEVAEFDVNDNIEFAEMPWAVIVDSEDKPVRKVQIDATSYINASEDEMVTCLVDGKRVSYPKKHIKTIV